MLLPFDIAHMQDQKFIILGYIVRDIMKIYVRGINTCPQNGISLVKYSLQFKATLSRWQNLKKSGWLFQVHILSSWFYHNDKTFFQLHCNGIVTFIKTGPVFVGFCCCKMCFCTLAFLKRCSWQCPFQFAKNIVILFCFGFIQWKPLRNSRFFAYIISRKQSANQRQKKTKTVYIE